MKIAIIGHGNVGAALAVGWARAGHQITIGTRKSPDQKADELSDEHSQISRESIDKAVEWAEVILVATPAQVTVKLAENWGPLPGKAIIDATNAIGQAPGAYETGYHAFLDICQAEVVKAFNTTGFENMKNPVYGDTTADMFVAGDSQEAKNTAIRLAQDIGFEKVYDFGGTDKVKALEHFAFGWINLAIMQGQGRQMAFKILKR